MSSKKRRTKGKGKGKGKGKAKRKENLFAKTESSRTSRRLQEKEKKKKIVEDAFLELEDEDEYMQIDVDIQQDSGDSSDDLLNEIDMFCDTPVRTAAPQTTRFSLEKLLEDKERHELIEENMKRMENERRLSDMMENGEEDEDDNGEPNEDSDDSDDDIVFDHRRPRTLIDDESAAVLFGDDGGVMEELGVNHDFIQKMTQMDNRGPNDFAYIPLITSERMERDTPEYEDATIQSVIDGTLDPNPLYQSLEFCRWVYELILDPNLVLAEAALDLWLESFSEGPDFDAEDIEMSFIESLKMYWIPSWSDIVASFSELGVSTALYQHKDSNISNLKALEASARIDFAPTKFKLADQVAPNLMLFFTAIAAHLRLAKISAHATYTAADMHQCVHLCLRSLLEPAIVNSYDVLPILQCLNAALALANHLMEGSLYSVYSAISDYCIRLFPEDIFLLISANGRLNNHGEDVISFRRVLALRSAMILLGSPDSPIKSVEAGPALLTNSSGVILTALNMLQEISDLVHRVKLRDINLEWLWRLVFCIDLGIGGRNGLVNPADEKTVQKLSQVVRGAIIKFKTNINFEVWKAGTKELLMRIDTRVAVFSTFDAAVKEHRKKSKMPKKQSQITGFMQPTRRSPRKMAKK